MCQDCVGAVREVFPEVPDEEMGDFLLETTCFPFGEPDMVRTQLMSNRRRMTTMDYRECYGIADDDLTKAAEAAKEEA